MLKKSRIFALVAGLSFAAAALVNQASAEELVIAARDGGFGKAMDKAITAFKSARPDVEIQLLKLPYGSLYEKLVISLREKSSSYDVVQLDDTWATEFMQHGWLKDLGSVDSDFIGATVEISKYPVKTGKLYSLPFVGNVEMFAYRADLFKKHGLAAPKSWTDVLKAARTINEKEDGVSGVVFRGIKGNPIVTGFLPILWAHDAKIIGEDGKAAINSKAGVSALTLYLELKNYAPKGVEVYNSTEVRDALQQGKAAIAIEVWPGWVPSMDDPAKSKVVGKMEITAAPGEVIGPSPMLGIWQLGIPAESDNAKTAREFMDFITSKSFQKELALGVGLPPTRASVYSDKEVVAKYRWYPAQLEALKNGKPRPRITKWKQVESILGDYLQLALVGQLDAKKALDLAAKDINRALKK